jgi:xylan 1,4-beta-xylosidase
VGRYLNPILQGCHPDPSLCRVGNEFFLVTSTFEYLPGLPVHVSRNLVDWRLIGHVIDRPGQLDLAGLPSSRGLFAPTIRHNGERFFVVCTVVGPDDGSWPGRAGHFLVTAVDAAGPWSDPVWIDGVEGIDPSLTFDGDRVWLTYTRQTEPAEWPGQTDVWLTELDPEAFQPVSDPVAIWGGALIGSVWAEGPHIVPRRSGGWMLVAAEGGTSREHAVCVAYADTIAGPYTGDPGNPRLTHRDLGRDAPVASVGHADLVDDVDGRTWATVLATRAVDGADGLLGRQTHLVPVEWQDARPVFSPRHGRVLLENDVAGVPDQQPRDRVFSADFVDAGPNAVPDAVLDPAWTGVARHPGTFTDLGARAGRLRIFAGAEPTTQEPQSFLARRLPDERTRVDVVLEVSPGSAVRGGVLLRTSETAHLELSIDGNGSATCVLVASGTRTLLGSSRTIPGSHALELTVRDLRASARVDGVTLAETRLDGLIPDPGSGFVGAWVGVFAAGDADCHVDVERVLLTALA